MNYDVSKNNLSVRNLVFEGSKEVPVDLDFSLPDYCPDIQKVLKCMVCPNITSRNISGDRLNIEGTTKIRVIYSDSENGKIRCCENSVPFSSSIDIRSTPENAFALTNLRVEYVNCRAVSPRKLDIHGAFSVFIEVYDKKNLEISSCINGKDIQQKISDMKVNNLVGMGQQQFTISEVLEIPEGKSIPELIINSDVKVNANEYKNMSNKTVIKGDIIIKMLYISDLSSGNTETLEYSIPISQIVDVPGITEESKCIVSIDVLAHDEQLRSDNDSSGALSCEIKLLANAIAFNDKDISIVSDAYSTDYDIDISTEPVKIEQLVESINENFNHKENISLSDITISKIIDAWTNSCSVNSSFQNGNLTFKCKMNVGILALDSEETPIYIERMLEFEHSKSLQNSDGSIICKCKIVPNSINYNISGNNGIEVNINFQIIGEIYLSHKYNMVTDVIADESKSIEKDTASLTVYYASEGENIWDIARRYHTSANMIKDENDISGDTVRTNGMILIPMK